ncbi:hypothetical protein VPKG_00027 [Vibrio phage pYD21-A]|uniref:hypothetical protein n=1 Tax=Vibrio phage pYD21-A TaxID=754049 RepID=UPI0002C12B47|nr:hypothetical protein VPKG_00027 [Vibrio phage pYD21-A]AGH16064.1 hypothetical protein VPKG_00027 [Vibrio phage pYD21-A]
MGWKIGGGTVSNFVSRMRQGVSAFIFQFYDEVNKKRGLQWEASRSVAAVNAGDKFYSIIKVGTKDVDLKARIIGATGGGAIGRAYKISDTDVTLGTPDKWYNYNSKVDVSLIQPETELYAGSEITFVTPVVNLAVEANKIHADIFAITNVQNQGKGVVFQAYGGNHILAPEDYILLELDSFDASQTITAKLDMYEGGLDFYP